MSDTPPTPPNWASPGASTPPADTPPPWPAPAAAPPWPSSAPAGAPAWPAPQTAPVPSGQAPASPLVWAIIATFASFFICGVFGIPAGIAAIHYATKVEPRWLAGDLDGSRRAARTAWIWLGVTVALDVALVAFVFVALAVGTSGT